MHGNPAAVLAAGAGRVTGTAALRAGTGAQRGWGRGRSRLGSEFSAELGPQHDLDLLSPCKLAKSVLMLLPGTEFRYNNTH